MEASASSSASAPLPGARGAQPLVPRAGSWAAGSNPGGSFTREELVDLGVPSREASQMVVRASLEQVIHATFARFGHIWPCAISLLLLCMICVMVWSQSIYNEHHRDACDTPLAPMINVPFIILIVKCFEKDITWCLLCYDLGRDGPVAPCRVRAFRWLLLLAGAGWPIVALVMLALTHDCSKALVEAVSVIVAYYALMAFVLVIAPACLISVVLCLVRRGLMRLPRSRAAAPETLIDDLPLEQFDAARFDDSGREGHHPTACAVCLDPFADDSRTISRTTCGHVFHTQCLRGWLDVARSCPLCRQDLTAPADEEESTTAEGP